MLRNPFGTSAALLKEMTKEIEMKKLILDFIF
jgi:hypothetical protein